VSLDTANVARFAAAVTAHLAAGGSAIIATHIDLGLSAAQSLDITPFIAKRLRAIPTRSAPISRRPRHDRAC
jgi:heme exporter protein A